MAAKKFPNLIHVTREEDGDSPWLQVHEGGVFDIQEPVPVAIYKLVDVGHVQILKSFQKQRPAKKKR